MDPKSVIVAVLAGAAAGAIVVGVAGGGGNNGEAASPPAAESSSAAAPARPPMPDLPVKMRFDDELFYCETDHVSKKGKPEKHVNWWKEQQDCGDLCGMELDPARGPGAQKVKPAQQALDNRRATYNHLVQNGRGVRTLKEVQGEPGWKQIVREARGQDFDVLPGADEYGHPRVALPGSRPLDERVLRCPVDLAPVRYIGG